MKKLLIWVLVAAQVAVLAYMAGEREWVQRTGQRVWLRTAPIDPRDPMRGYYVRLRYEASEVPWALCRGEVAAWDKQGREKNSTYYDYRFTRKLRDHVVYAELSIDASGAGSVVALHASEPEGKLFMRGRVEKISEAGVEVRYGIEALFTEQGVARKIEDEARGEKEGLPMRIEVGIGRGGLAVMRRYEWETLGMRVELVRKEVIVAADGNRRERREQRVVGAKVILKNYGTEPLVLATRGSESFRLIPAQPRWMSGGGDWRWALENAVKSEQVSWALADIKVLPAGETWVEQIDFRHERWRVIQTGIEPAEAKAFADLENAWSARFRFEYTSPKPEELLGFNLAAKPWLGRIVSRAFNPTGGVD